SSACSHTRIRCAAVMKPATNVHPAAGQGKGFVRTQNQPLWCASSPLHSSSCQLSPPSAKTACPGSMRPCSTAKRLPVWTEPLSGTLGAGSGSLPRRRSRARRGARLVARPPGPFCNAGHRAVALHAEPEALCEPIRLSLAFLVIPTGTVTPLCGARCREARDRDSTRRHEVIDVADVTRADRQEADAFAGPCGAEATKLGRERIVPAWDALHQPSPLCDDLA